MGSGVLQRTVQQGRNFDAVFDVTQTSALVDWGRCPVHLSAKQFRPRANRLFTKSPSINNAFPISRMNFLLRRTTFRLSERRSSAD